MRARIPTLPSFLLRLSPAASNVFNTALSPNKLVHRALTILHLPIASHCLPAIPSHSNLVWKPTLFSQSRSPPRFLALSVAVGFS